MSIVISRPQSIAEIALQATGAGDFDCLVAEFLDEFKLHPSFEHIRKEPLFLNGRFEKGEIMDAYLGAVAEHLADKNGFPCPPWAEKRGLPHPWFTHPSANLRAVLLIESPTAFRKRNLFVSENALNRA